VQKIRTISSDCQIDAGGLTFVWLGAVAPGQSVALLKSFAADAADKTRAEPALSAIALHQDPSASAVLFDLAKNGIRRIRERALFWIARRAESRAAATISDAIDHDPDDEVKKQAVFALSQLPNSEGVPLLIALARGNANPTVRKQAFFWLGQSKDPRALTFFEEVLR
jgi:HEAT repeat protein